MGKSVAVPPMPMGSKFDAEKTVAENAAVAWEAEKSRRRQQREHNAKVLARRVFRTDELEFEYDQRIGLDTPTFTMEGELILYNGEDFSLIEYCADCGKEPKGRRFGSLAGFGRVIEESDLDDDHVCRMCMMLAEARGKR